MVSLFFNQVATWLISFAILVIAPANLGSTGFGRIQFVLAFLAFFGLVGSFGSTQWIIKRVARDPSSLPSLVTNGLALKLCMGLLLSGIAQGVAFLLGYRGQTLLLVLIGSVTVVCTLMNEILIAAFSGLERMARPAIWSTIQVYIGHLVGLVVLFTTRSLALFALGYAAASLVPLCANYVAIRSMINGPHAQSLDIWKGILRGGAALLAIASLGLVYGTIDVPILEKMAGSEVVGWYSVAYRWISVPIFTTTIVVAALLPRLSMSAQSTDGTFQDLANKAIRLVTVITVPASVGIAVVARQLFELLYQDQYSKSVILARLLTIHIPIAAIDSVLVVCMIAQDRQRKFFNVALVAAIFNPILDIIAIHWSSRYAVSGAFGASIITVLTEVFISVSVIRMRTRGILDRSTIFFVLRCFGAAGAMSAAMLVLGRRSFAIDVVVGCTVYALASVALRTVPIEMIRSAWWSLRARTSHAVITSETDTENNA
jgi:O-antigen/teichoic acid export membrane protein